MRLRSTSDGASGRSEGYLLYDRRATGGSVAPDVVANKTPDGSIGLDVHNPPDSIHVTQVYKERFGKGVRVSWDAHADGSITDKHVTNQNRSKGSKNRHNIQ